MGSLIAVLDMPWIQLRSALRSFRRHRGYAAINVVGLSIGIASCLVIGLFVRDELSYDRFHEAGDRIYRVTVTRSFPNGTVASAATPRPVASALEAEYPEVQRATRVSRENAERVLVAVGDRSSFEDGFFFADDDVFEVLSFDFVRGRAETALADPFSIVMTESAAGRYFGETDPIGKTVTVRLRGDSEHFDYIVKGVIRDTPANSHIRPQLIATYRGHPLVGEEDDGQNWGGLNLYTYVLLAPDAKAFDLERKLPDMVEKYVGPIVERELGISYSAFLEAGNAFAYDLQPIRTIHLSSNLANEIAPTGSRLYVYVFTSIALFILLLACFNFVNLAAARSTGRLKEVGVRKALGSDRAGLRRQFLFESTLLSFIATALAVGLVELVLPFFNRLAGKSIHFDFLGDPVLLPAMLLLALIVALAAGFYPAVTMAAFDPAQALRGNLDRTVAGKSTFRRGLVVLQFGVAIALIASTLVVYRQMEFSRNKELGFDREQVVLVEGTEILSQQIEVFKESLRKLSGVLAVANTQAVPGEPLNETDVRLEGTPEEGGITVSWMTTNYDFVETLGLEIVTGRSFNRNLAADSMAVMLNESAVTALGSAYPLGRNIVYEDRRYNVIGVVKDFHFASLHEPIRPLVLFGPDPFNEARPNLLVVVRIAPENVASTLKSIEKSWSRFVPDQPLVYSFLDEEFETAYRTDRTTGRLFAVFSGLAIMIACLGLIGLASLVTARRTKEIGIRKVLGARVSGLVSMLSMDFLGLVLVAFVIAAPTAYVGMSRWLERFAYRIEMSAWTLAAAGAIALLMALLSVGYQSARAALADPVKALRYE